MVLHNHINQLIFVKQNFVFFFEVQTLFLNVCWANSFTIWLVASGQVSVTGPRVSTVIQLVQHTALICTNCLQLAVCVAVIANLVS